MDPGFLTHDAAHRRAHQARPCSFRSAALTTPRPATWRPRSPGSNLASATLPAPDLLYVGPMEFGVHVLGFRSRVTDHRQPSAEDERVAHLAAVVDASSDAILSKTLTGTITSWNASAERIFGYTAEEIIGKNIRVLIPEERQAEEDEILARLRRGEFIEHYETVRIAKDGRLIDVSLSISPVRDQAGRIVGASKIARDITARRQAEEALAAVNAKFESVFNQSGIFAGILDTEGIVRDVNVLALEASGYTRDDVIGLPFWETPWWRDSEAREGTHPPCRANGPRRARSFAETLPYFLADGSERVVEFAMHPIVDDARRHPLLASDRDRHHRPGRS